MPSVRLSPQLHRRGFRCLHGVDGSAGMLERARSTGLYRRLLPCVVGREPLPAPAGNGPEPGAGMLPWRVPPPPPGDATRVPTEHYDAVTVVGALGEGQVPAAAVPELLRVTKPGEGVSPRPPRCRLPAGTPELAGRRHQVPVDDAGPVAQPGRGLVPAARSRQGCAVAARSLALPAGQAQAGGRGGRWRWHSGCVTARA